MKRYFATFFGLIVFFAFDVHAVAVCSSKDILRIPRPLHPQKPALGSFEYAFQFIPGPETDENAVTIVFLPGGPGSTSIGSAKEVFEDILPHPRKVHFLMTDPRGVGCNEVPSPPAGFYSSAIFSQDILAAIKHLKLTNYIVYGHSYGSLLATVLAADIATSYPFQPRAVVLTGVLGRAFQKGEGFWGWNHEWQAILNSTSPFIQRQLTSTPLPLGATPEAWGNVISAFLISGSLLPGKPNFLGAYLTGLEPDADPTMKTSLQKLLQKASQVMPKPAPFVRLHREITCHEIMNDDDGLALIDGQLKAAGQPECTGIAFDHPFDSARYRIQAPILYISGLNDPATPPYQAKYHFDAHPQNQKFLLGVPGAGHVPGNLILDCLPQIWDAVINDFSKVGLAAQECAVKVSVTSH